MTTQDSERATQVIAQTNGAPPRLAAGIELIGVYEGSGFKEPPYIARREDGQIIQRDRRFRSTLGADDQLLVAHAQVRGGLGDVQHALTPRHEAPPPGR